MGLFYHILIMFILSWGAVLPRVKNLRMSITEEKPLKVHDKQLPMYRVLPRGRPDPHERRD